MVQIEEELMVQAFDVFQWGDNGLKILILQSILSVQRR